MIIPREQIELIEDGEYGLYEGTSDIKVSKEDIIETIKSLGYNIKHKPEIWFDSFQGFYRFNGSLEINEEIINLLGKRQINKLKAFENITKEK